MHHIFNINALYMTENSSRKVVHFYSGGIFLWYFAGCCKAKNLHLFSIFYNQKFKIALCNYDKVHQGLLIKTTTRRNVQCKTGISILFFSSSVLNCLINDQRVKRNFALVPSESVMSFLEGLFNAQTKLIYDFALRKRLRFRLRHLAFRMLFVSLYMSFY